MILLLTFSFLAGMVTILAPCIWPVLPIVLSSSMGKGHQRPLGITLGVMISFTVLTLFTSYLIRIFHFDPNVLRMIAVVIIAFLGLSMIIPALSTRLELLVSRLTSAFGNRGNQHGNGFVPGFITGLSLGVLWTPCAGPILATIAALAATGKVNSDVVLLTIAYVLGLGIPLFAIAYGGKKLITQTRGLSKYTGRIQQIFGVITILAAIAIFTHYDQKLQIKLIEAFPKLGTAVNGFESSGLVSSQLQNLTGAGQKRTGSSAPDLIGITQWFNLPDDKKSLTLSDLKGKVVLIDFWTYTCINCLRTLPHINSWYQKYKDQGFVVIGVHTPEFVFERDAKNVQNAIKSYAIAYPVAQDNNYATWNNYHNEYWPAEYLIDATGNIRHTHFGEGDYSQTESAIQTLLKEAGQKVVSFVDELPDQTPTIALSPETYLGAKRMQYYYPTGSLGIGVQNLTLSKDPNLNSFSLGGTWNITNENAITGEHAILNYHFYAAKVFLVLRPGTAAAQAKVKLFLDDQPVTSANQGSDVVNGEITITSDKLYNLIDLQGNVGNHTLRLEFQYSGIELFAFTFG